MSEDVKVELGDYVQKGQTLASIRSGEVADFERQSIQAQLRLTAGRKKPAGGAGSVRKQTQLPARSGCRPERSRKGAGRSKPHSGSIQIYGIGKSSTYTVKAPIAGYMIEKNVNRGTQLRSDNADNLFTIGQISEVWVLANVNESDIGRVTPGYERQHPDAELTRTNCLRGKVDKIYTVLDPGTKAMTVRIRLRITGP